MNSGDMPVSITLHIDYIRQQVLHSVALHNDEIGEMVKRGVEKAFSTRNIEAEIHTEINKAITQAIESLSKSYAVNEAIHQIVRDALRAKSAEIRAKDTP